MTIYDYEATDIAGNIVKLSDYQNKVMLVVNTASKCGFTKQYGGLEALYQEFKDNGLVILGFPCNQFGNQESGDESEIKHFCQINFGVTFPLFSKIKVNGVDAHPLYVYLKKQAKGVLGTESIKWNFTKFLVNKQGKVLERYAPKDAPESLREVIVKLLG